jgi:hypothetical protein
MNKKRKYLACNTKRGTIEFHRYISELRRIIDRAREIGKPAIVKAFEELVARYENG